MNMDKVKDHFEDEAQEFDRIILTLIPHYAAMIHALVDAIPRRTGPLRVIDLGCGTGTVAAKILENFPGAQVTCIDLAGNMISLAQSRLARYSQMKYVVADFRDFDFVDKYDVVASSLALHHLVSSEDKQDFYRRIYESLDSGGVFYNADVVLASNESMQAVYMNAWRRYMSGSISGDEIESKWIQKFREEDHPAKLIDQLTWMTEIGFVDVDVIWKYYNFAVYGGVRQ